MILMFAVIKTGGKQYIAAPGKKINVEKLGVEPGEPVVFDNVLLVCEEDKIKVGAPLVTGASVHAKACDQFRARKVIVFKYHSKTRHRKKSGHRQHMTEVEIEKILTA